MKILLSVPLLALFFSLAVMAEEAKETQQSIVEYLSLQNIDGIEIALAPKSDWNASEVKNARVENKDEINQWIALLSKISARGQIKVSWGDEPKEYAIKFYTGKKEVASLRIMESSLDSPAGEGWDFYAGGADKEFVAVVQKKL